MWFKLKATAAENRISYDTSLSWNWLNWWCCEGHPISFLNTGVTENPVSFSRWSDKFQLSIVPSYLHHLLCGSISSSASFLETFFFHLSFVTMCCFFSSISTAPVSLENHVCVQIHQHGSTNLNGCHRLEVKSFEFVAGDLSTDSTCREQQQEKRLKLWFLYCFYSRNIFYLFAHHSALWALISGVQIGVCV